MMSFRKAMIAGATLLGTLMLPGLAQAANGYATSPVNMRAGPGTNYPAITTVPRNAAVEIFGCVNGFTWCDTLWRGYRGWVSSRYLEFFYRDQRYSLPDYGPRYGIPIIRFDFGYWDRYYSDRPWYHDRPGRPRPPGGPGWNGPGPGPGGPGWNGPPPRPPVVANPPVVRPIPGRGPQGLQPQLQRCGPDLCDMNGNRIPRTSDEYDVPGGPG